MSPLAEAKRLVVKVGSALLVRQDGAIHQEWLAALCEDVAHFRKLGCEVILVTSGAIAVGRHPLGLKAGPLRLDEKQAAAATGQIRLAHAYQQALAAHHLACAQVLITIDDSENRRRFLNARNTLNTLLRLGAVPVINENDTVATQEIRFGDNDRLAARVAQMVGADALVLLSDIDGLYTADPRRDANAEFIPEIHELTPEIEAMAGDPTSAVGTGGMVTKLLAARIALGAGCKMAIAPGKPMRPLRAMQSGRCSWFLPKVAPLTARKQWIKGAIKPQGKLTVDAGASGALSRGGSLLPAGIREVAGEFQKGDAVLVLDQAGREVARGLAAYGADEARRLLGRKSAEFEQLLGYRGPDEMIHRDDLVLSA